MDSSFLDEIAETLIGEKYTDDSALLSDLKRLKNRPRRVRDLKLAMEPFTHSALNTRFATEELARDAILGMAPDTSEDELAIILRDSYTGWVWTSGNFARLFSSAETWRIVINTVLYVTMTLSFNVLVGLLLAITTFYLPRGVSSVFTVIWLLPRITPVVLYAIMWKWFTWDDDFSPRWRAVSACPRSTT